MKTLLTIISLIVYLNCYSQLDRDLFVDDSVNIFNCSLSMSDSEKIIELKKAIYQTDSSLMDVADFYQMDNRTPNNIALRDLNNDGEIDLIYSNNESPDYSLLFIFFKINGEYKYSIFNHANIQKLYFTPEKQLSKIVSFYGWCCMNPIAYYQVSEISYSDTSIVKSMTSYGIFNKETFPKSFDKVQLEYYVDSTIQISPLIGAEGHYYDKLLKGEKVIVLKTETHNNVKWAFIKKQAIQKHNKNLYILGWVKLNVLSLTTYKKQSLMHVPQNLAD